MKALAQPLTGVWAWGVCGGCPGSLEESQLLPHSSVMGLFPVLKHVESCLVASDAPFLPDFVHMCECTCVSVRGKEKFLFYQKLAFWGREGVWEEKGEEGRELQEI